MVAVGFLWFLTSVNLPVRGYLLLWSCKDKRVGLFPWFFGRWTAFLPMNVCWKLCSEASQYLGPARRKGELPRWNRKVDGAEIPQDGHIARKCYNPCLDKLLLLDERLCIFIYQMLEAEVMENEGEFLALGWSICVGLCNRDPELRIVTELAWSWPGTSFKSTWCLARKEYLWEQLQFGTELQCICEHRCETRRASCNSNGKYLPNHSEAAAFGCIALNPESVHMSQLCLSSRVVLHWPCRGAPLQEWGPRGTLLQHSKVEHLLQAPCMLFLFGKQNVKH